MPFAICAETAVIFFSGLTIEFARPKLNKTTIAITAEPIPMDTSVRFSRSLLILSIEVT
ncbi:hypothetical protein D3C87_1942420 [compost metagenome]